MIPYELITRENKKYMKNIKKFSSEFWFRLETWKREQNK